MKNRLKKIALENEQNPEPKNDINKEFNDKWLQDAVDYRDKLVDMQNKNKDLEDDYQA